jgi:hypothetical protein
MGYRNSARKMEFYSSFRNMEHLAAKLLHSALLFQSLFKTQTGHFVYVPGTCPLIQLIGSCPRERLVLHGLSALRACKD